MQQHLVSSLAASPKIHFQPRFPPSKPGLLNLEYQPPAECHPHQLTWLSCTLPLSLRISAHTSRRICLVLYPLVLSPRTLCILRRFHSKEFRHFLSGGTTKVRK